MRNRFQTGSGFFSGFGFFDFPIFQSLHSPHGKEEQREQNADHRADGNFFWFVSDALFESREARFVELQLLGEIVEIPRVVAHVDAQAERVEDDDDGKRERDGERSMRETVDERDRGDERRNECRVRAWHVSVGDRVAQIPAVFSAIIGKLDGLGDEAHENRDKKQHDFIADHTRDLKYQRISLIIHYSAEVSSQKGGYVLESGWIDVMFQF